MLVNRLPSISSKSKVLSSSKNSSWWQRCCRSGLRWWRWFYWWLWGLLKVQLHSGQLLIRVITVSHSHCALCIVHCAATPVESSVTTVAVAVGTTQASLWAILTVHCVHCVYTGYTVVYCLSVLHFSSYRLEWIVILGVQCIAGVGLHCIARSIEHCIALHWCALCILLQCSALHCCALHCYALHWCALHWCLHCTVQCSAEVRLHSMRIPVRGDGTVEAARGSQGHRFMSNDDEHPAHHLQDHVGDQLHDHVDDQLHDQVGDQLHGQIWPPWSPYIWPSWAPLSLRSSVGVFPNKPFLKV